MEKGDVPTLVQPPGETPPRGPAQPRTAPRYDDTGGGGWEGRRERESKVDYIISPPLPGAHPPFCEC